MPVEEQGEEQEQADGPGHDQGGTPAELQGKPHHDDGRERITEIAAERVEAVGPAVAGAADTRGEDREIGRMKHAVAEPR